MRRVFFLKKNLLRISLLSILTASTMVLSACTNSTSGKNSGESPNSKVVNVYSDRHYDTDKQLLEEFTKDTGIKVNIIEGSSDELIERLAREGKDSQADALITADVGRLHRAKEQGLLQNSTSDIINKNIPENLRDSDGEWVALTKRARVIVYSKDRVKPEELSTYEDLAGEKWKGKVVTRSSTAVYNQSLLASLIYINGEESSKNWAQGIVNNLSKEPKGNDRDQVKAIAAGEGDVTLVNTYYIGKMINSSDKEEVKAAEKVGVFFPNQNTTGTHVNISGVGITKSAKNKDNAVKLIEFLSSEKAQKLFAEANYEYPANPAIAPSELLKSWGDFKAQDINLSKLGEFNNKAVEIFNQVGWK